MTDIPVTVPRRVSTRLLVAMEDQQPVQAMYVTDNWRGPHAIGRLVAYCEAPMVCIETEAGEQVWWRADLVEPIGDDRELTP